MIAEAETLPASERRRWYLAAAGLALTSRLEAWALPLQAAGLALAMIVVDWVWGAFLPALALIGLSAAMLTKGSTQPRGVAFLTAAGTLPLAHALANWVPPLRPEYQYAPLDHRDWLILALVAGVGICAVRVAELLRHVRRQP